MARATALEGDRPRPVRIEIARVGARRDVVHTASVDADDHATPTDAYERGCGWPSAAGVVVDASWQSGFYEVVLEIDDGDKQRRSHAFFVVRPSTPGAPILLVGDRVHRLPLVRHARSGRSRADRAWSRRARHLDVGRGRHRRDVR